MPNKGKTGVWTSEIEIARAQRYGFVTKRALCLHCSHTRTTPANVSQKHTNTKA
ncbi:unnamed protein product [Ectocarpus sp. 12 AP-2014]